MVRAEWVESAQGPPRKYYALTPAGRQLFDELRQEFDLLVSLVQRKRTAAQQPEPARKGLLVRKE
jgi:DNA-binding PadR family transcriptional regulator